MKNCIVTYMLGLSVLVAVLLVFGMVFLFESGLYRLQTVVVLLLAILAVAVMIEQSFAKKIVAPIQNIHMLQSQPTVAYEELRPLLQHEKQQRMELDQKIAELKEKQREFTTLTENMSEGLVVLNDKGEILSINPCAMRILGLQNQTCCENQHISEAIDNWELQKIITEGLQGNRRDITVEIERRIYQVVLNPIDHVGQTQGMVLLLLDVTEKQQQEQLRREFTANVSHELRTPLTAISGYAEIMTQGLVPIEHMQSFAERIYQEANRLIDLIADIIQLSQLDEAAVQFQWEYVDLAQLAEAVQERLQPKAEEQQIVFTVYTEPTVMMGIAQVMQEILYNLCDNAIKYNKPGGSVKLSVVQSGGFAVIKVADTGIGIATEDQPRVFERFYRADKSHSSLIGGTGLGLSIVKHGVQLLHGEIQLESESSIGTIITVRLPITNLELE